LGDFDCPERAREAQRIGPGRRVFSDPEKVRNRDRKSGKPPRNDGFIAFEPQAQVPAPDREGGERREDLPDLDVSFEVVAKLLLSFVRQFRVGDYLYGDVGRN
jgi:hypothetical protein